MRESVLTEVFTYSPPLSELPLDRKTIERHLGYRDGQAPQPLTTAIESLLPHIAEHIHLQCGFRILPAETVSIEHDTVVCDGAVLAMGSVITRQLKNSSSLALYVCSAGHGMEHWSSELMGRGDMMEGFVVDAIASDLVEEMSGWLEHKIVEAVQSRGWTLTNRYSPGYCDWPVSDQHQLFSLLPPEFCGVTLTQSALMVPVKSLSGIIGVGKGVKRGAYQCSICDLKDCYRRREEPEPAAGT